MDSVNLKPDAAHKLILGERIIDPRSRALSVSAGPLRDVCLYRIRAAGGL